MTTVTISPWPLVKKGDQGQPVLTLQHLLQAHGSGLVADGIFGPEVDAAVRGFQQTTNLTVDGVVGRKTWEALVIQVRRGSRGDAVRAVQYELQLRGLPEGPSQGVQVDGIFGPETEATVRAFQDALSLTVDGIVGPVTWRALVSGMLALDC
jgi:peptidoglycan hydrolase-like protein with peptidoglycan-binding domain